MINNVTAALHTLNISTEETVLMPFHNFIYLYTDTSAENGCLYLYSASVLYNNILFKYLQSNENSPH